VDKTTGPCGQGDRPFEPCSDLLALAGAWDNQGSELSTLLCKADVAMHKAKASGRGPHVYQRGDDAADGARLRAVEQLTSATRQPGEQGRAHQPEEPGLRASSPMSSTGG
jgi:hypothetical protein